MEKGYEISLKLLKQGRRSISLSECSVEASVELSSEFLDAHEYLLGKNGAICSAYDTKLIEKESAWSSWEFGVFYTTSDTKDKLALSSDESKIFYDYANIAMYGLNATYLYKVLDSQYAGLKLSYAFAPQTYTSTPASNTKTRADGDPRISKVGAGVVYGYRYHIKTEVSTALNVYTQNVTKTYTNNTYETTFTTVDLEVGVGYYIMPSIKLWGSINSELCYALGVSYVF